MIDYLKRKYSNLVSDTRFSEILTGSAWALSARVFATVTGFIFSVLVARMYGAEMVGIVAVVNSFLLLATIFTVLGTSTSILRLIPEHLSKYSPSSAFRVYRKTQIMVVVASIVTGTFFFFSSDLIASKVFSKPHLSYYFALASVFIVFQSIMKLNTEAVRGLRFIRAFALMLLLPQSCNILFLLGLSHVWPTADAPVYATLGGFAVTGIIGWGIMEYAFRRKAGHNDIVHPVTSRSILSISLPMLMTATMNFAIGQTGVIMIGMFCSEAKIGYYAIAVKLATLTGFILSAVNSMVGPQFSELYHTGKIEELFYIAQKSAKLIFWTTTPILLTLIFFGRFILNFAFGPEFVCAYFALCLLAAGQFVHSVSGATGLFMNMTGKQNIYRNIMAIAAVMNICLNLLLIPLLGINGAGLAAMTSIGFWNLSTLFYIKSYFGKTTGYLPFINGLL